MEEMKETLRDDGEDSNPEAKRQFSRPARSMIIGNLAEIAAVTAQPLQLRRLLEGKQKSSGRIFDDIKYLILFSVKCKYLTRNTGKEPKKEENTDSYKTLRRIPYDSIMVSLNILCYRVTLGFGSIAGGLDHVNPVIRLPLEHRINGVLVKDDHSNPSVGTNPVTASIT
ncbi:hypothetical protein Tco_0335498 [Tanacetum coccineum]